MASSDSNSVSGDPERRGTVSRRETGLVQITRDRENLAKAEEQVWELIANKYLPPEESELMVKRLERTEDARTRRTYVNGIAQPQPIDSALTLKVGLTFLPGADKAQVTRLEQNAMSSAPPDQKNALWRVNTAATLLKDYIVNDDLSLKEVDRTATIAAEAREYRRKHRKSNGSEPSIASLSASLPEDPQTSKVLVKRSTEADAVTIDSEQVQIVRDLRVKSHWDVEATLIEVDGSSLLGLITNYRWLISRGGPEMAPEETRDLLDTMIENARRLCVRSPILFRMSTRKHIINSRNTRYGIDHAGGIFRTITTSQGIKEIIRWGVAYFDALDPEGGNDSNQQLVRPRFLQMISLLCMFLNEFDLNELRPLLQATYQIRANRKDIELLLLKVVPLSSINPRVFLEALIPTVDRPLGCNAEDHRQAEIWDIFVRNILREGYLLPAGLDDLGRNQNSWIATWPEGGYKSTTIFNHLQYHGQTYRTVNQIPAIDLHPEDSFKELTVQLSDGKDYVVESAAIDSMTRMNSGLFVVQDASNTSQWGAIELEIQEIHISEELESVVLDTNSLIDDMNNLLAAVQPRGVFRRSKYVSLNNFEGTGRITKHTAILHQKVIAVRYKVEGRKVKKRDAWRILGQSYREVQVLLRELQHRAQKVFGERLHDFKVQIQDINVRLGRVIQRVNAIEVEKDYPDEPIAQLLFPDAGSVGKKAGWYDYEAWTESNAPSMLHLNAQMSQVQSVYWDPVTRLGVVRLCDHPRMFTVEPLTYPGKAPIAEDALNDEIRSNDHAALAGQYMVIGEPCEDGRGGLLMTNYLKIVGSEEVVKNRRGANRSKPEQVKSYTCFL